MRENSLNDVDGYIIRTFEFLHTDLSGKEPVTRRVEATIFKLRRPVIKDNMRYEYVVDMNGVFINVIAPPEPEELKTSWERDALPEFNLRVY